MMVADGKAPPLSPGLTRDVGVVVLPGFSMLAQACATEPLHVANRLAGRTLYRLSTFAVDERPVASASGQALLPQAAAAASGASLDLLLVCAPGPLAGSVPQSLLDWLQRLAAARVVLGGIGGGTEVLARTGVLDGYRATLPWPRFEAFARDYPRVRLSQQLFEIDRDRLTCGGGTAAMDMMMTLVGSHHGDELAERISEHFVLERIRMGDEPQQVPLRTRLGHAPQSLVDAVALMESNIEEPLTTHELAEHLASRVASSNGCSRSTSRPCPVATTSTCACSRLAVCCAKATVPPARSPCRPAFPRRRISPLPIAITLA